MDFSLGKGYGVKDLQPILLQKFTQFGYIHSSEASVIRPFTMPSDFAFTPIDDVVKKFDDEVQAPIVGSAPSPAASPSTKQRTIRSYFTQK